LWLAEPSHAVLADTIIGKAVCSALLSSSALVLVATKGRHPGWAGLLVAALLVLAGMLA